MRKETNIFKVSGHSGVPSLAGAIVKSIEDNRGVELHAIGASSVNQSTKAIATARGILASRGYDILVRIGFDQVSINDNERTMMKFILVIQ